MYFLTKKHILFSFLLIKKGTRTRNQQKISLKETKKDETKTVQRAAQASHYPPTKLCQVYGSRDSPCLASSLILPSSAKVEASRRSKVLAFLSFQISQFTSSRSDLISFFGTFRSFPMKCHHSVTECVMPHKLGCSC